MTFTDMLLAFVLGVLAMAAVVAVALVIVFLIVASEDWLPRLPDWVYHWRDKIWEWISITFCVVMLGFMAFAFGAGILDWWRS